MRVGDIPLLITVDVHKRPSVVPIMEFTVKEKVREVNGKMEKVSVTEFENRFVAPNVGGGNFRDQSLTPSQAIRLMTFNV